MVSAIRSPVNAWYMDDGTIVGDLETVSSDFQSLSELATALGLRVNSSKCEFTCVSKSTAFVDVATKRLRRLAPGIRNTRLEGLELLGVPLHEEGIGAALQSKLQLFEDLTSRLGDLDAHDALFLLRNSLAVPRLMYLLRCAPCYDDPALALCQSKLKDVLERILNCKLNDAQYQQASLPVARGGLGVRDPKDVALPAYLASVHSSVDLCMAISGTSSEVVAHSALDVWDKQNASRPETDGLKTQKLWDRLVCDRVVHNFTENFKKDKRRMASFLAASAPKTGSWLQALPIPNLGLKLTDEELRTATSLRLDLDLNQEYTCICGAKADSKGRFRSGCESVRPK